MERWAADDGVDFEHFRAVMKTWLGARREEQPDDVAARDEQPDDVAASVLAEGAVAGLEQAVDQLDAGPPGTSPVHRLERGELTPAEFEHALAAELALHGSA